MSKDTSFITVPQLAIEIGLERSTCLRAIKKAGFSTHFRRLAGSRGQRITALTTEQAASFRALRCEQGYPPTPIESGHKGIRATSGSFYAIAVAPDLDAHRIKLGFTESINARLLEHQTVAPTAVLLRSWPCQRSWETAAIAALTAIGAQIIRNEVYVIENVAMMLERGDVFFAMMPKAK